MPGLAKVKPLTFIITFLLKKNIHLHCYMKHMLPFISKILFSASLCVRSQDRCCNLNPAISPSRVEIVCSSSCFSCSGTTVTSVQRVGTGTVTRSHNSVPAGNPLRESGYDPAGEVDVNDSPTFSKDSEIYSFSGETNISQLPNKPKPRTPLQRL